MRAFVLTDASLGRYAGRFVWLSIDLENPRNAAFLAKYPVPATPLLLVIDPRSESVALRYDGGVTAAQLRELLTDGAGIVRGTRRAADAAIARADRLAIAKENAEAAKAYEEALATAPKSWPRAGRAAESLLIALRDAKQYERCASRAVELYAPLAGTLSGANVAGTGLRCAIRHEKRPDLTDSLAKTVRAEIDNSANGLDPAYRADLYLELISRVRRLNDEAATRTLREEAAAFLEKEAAKAQTPDQRFAFVTQRMSVYNALGLTEKLIPILQEAEREMPHEYMPSVYLTLTYMRLKKYDEALAASDRARALVYGPATVLVLTDRADIYQAKDDKAAAQQVIREAIAFAEALPVGQRNENTIASLKKKLPVE